MKLLVLLGLVALASARPVDDPEWENWKKVSKPS